MEHHIPANGSGQSGTLSHCVGAVYSWWDARVVRFGLWTARVCTSFANSSRATPLHAAACVRTLPHGSDRQGQGRRRAIQTPRVQFDAAYARGREVITDAVTRVYGHFQKKSYWIATITISI